MAKPSGSGGDGKQGGGNQGGGKLGNLPSKNQGKKSGKGRDNAPPRSRKK